MILQRTEHEVNIFSGLSCEISKYSDKCGASAVRKVKIKSDKWSLRLRTV